MSGSSTAATQQVLVKQHYVQNFPNLQKTFNNGGILWRKSWRLNILRSSMETLIPDDSVCVFWLVKIRIKIFNFSRLTRVTFVCLFACTVTPHVTPATRRADETERCEFVPDLRNKQHPTSPRCQAEAFVFCLFFERENCCSAMRCDAQQPPTGLGLMGIYCGENNYLWANAGSMD